MSEENKRFAYREKCYSKIVIEGRYPGYIRDLTKGGAKIDVAAPLEIKAMDRLSCLILPLEELGIAPFKATLEVRWEKSGSLFHTLGTSVHLSDPSAENGYERLLKAFADEGSMNGRD
jgi:hypothetical protein